MAEQKRYSVEISVRISDWQNGGGLNMSENFPCNASDFLQVANIIGKFHVLKEAMLKEMEAEELKNG